MSVKEIVVSKRMTKKCELCDQPLKAGEPAIEFDSNGIGRYTTTNRVCVHCLIGIVQAYEKKRNLEKGKTYETQKHLE